MSSVHAHGAEGMKIAMRAGIHVLEAATCRNSELVGMSDSIGTVTVGKPADIVAVDGDPLKDMETMNHVSFVMKDGKVYKK